MRTSAQRLAKFRELFPSDTSSDIEHSFHEQICSESKMMFILNTEVCTNVKIETSDFDAMCDNLMCENYCHMIESYRGLMQVAQLRVYLESQAKMTYDYYKKQKFADEKTNKESYETLVKTGESFCEMIKKEINDECQYMRVYDADCEMFVLI